MRILWVGTKPPWPPSDGGRLVAATTIQALTEAGHALTVVAPFDPSRDDAARAAEGLRPWCEPVLVASRPRAFAGAALASVARGQPLSVVRHALEAVGARVAELLSARAFDVVHAEQPQALAQCRHAFDRGVPVVLRAQNVEADLWAASAVGRPVLGLLARLEAGRMARFEGGAVRRTAATVALTVRDADRLRALSGAPEKVRHVAAPFPASLPAGEGPLPGAPAVTLVASGGWLPNQQGAAWFVRAVWPEVLRALPAARLHLFGDASGEAAGVGVVRHVALTDSRQAFAAGSTVVVPLPFGSGVRMKILEAWARGVPVLATPAAALGLDAEDGRELLLARTAAEFTAALRRLSEDPALGPALAAAGRERLAARHLPARIAAELAGVYASCGVRPL
jgi:hypothetical protein